jgi:hypothetical protein
VSMLGTGQSPCVRLRTIGTWLCRTLLAPPSSLLAPPS